MRLGLPGASLAPSIFGIPNSYSGALGAVKRWRMPRPTGRFSLGKKRRQVARQRPSPRSKGRLTVRQGMLMGHWATSRLAQTRSLRAYPTDIAGATVGSQNPDQLCCISEIVRVVSFADVSSATGCIAIWRYSRRHPSAPPGVRQRRSQCVRKCEGGAEAPGAEGRLQR